MSKLLLLRFWVLATAVLWMASPAAAQTATTSGQTRLPCQYWQFITFSDGERRCIGDTPLAAVTPTGATARLPELLSPRGAYAIAAARAESCPRVLGFASSAGHYVHPQDIYKSASTKCEEALAKQGRADCGCSSIVQDGRSDITYSQMTALLAQASAAATHAAPAPVPSTGAPACAFWKQIAFADGQRACLADYEFANQPPRNDSRTIDSMATSTSGVIVHATPTTTCPSVVTASPLSYFDSGRSAGSTALITRETNKGQCNASPGAANGGCSCIAVLDQGISSLTKSEFDARFARRGAVPQAPAQSPERVQQAPTSGPLLANAPTTQPAANRPAAAPAPQTPSTQEQALAETQKALAEMRQQLAELQNARTPAGNTPGQAAASNAPRLRGQALVIGNSRYTSFGALANPGRDARAIANKLRSFGMEVDLVLDAQRDDIIHALNQHQSKAAGKDVSILYYAGHGVQVEGVNYLVPVNMRADGISAGYIKLAGISLNAALDYMPTKARIVFLDACRDNPASRSLAGARGGSGAGLAPIQAGSGTLVSYATRDGAVAEDGAGQNSPYTTALLQYLDQPEDISLVLRQVREAVLKATSGRQEPWEYGSLVGSKIVLSNMAR